MKILGIDYGDRYIGFAECDPDEIIAYPLETAKVKSMREAIDAAAEIAARDGAELIVVGLPLLPDGSALSYEEAVRFLLSREKIDPKRRNVILSHQFYTAGQSEPETCDSEAAVAMAGGLDKIDVSVLDAFDYAALGHLHGSQRVGRESVRYCGTPYKYSVSEERHHKAVTVVWGILWGALFFHESITPGKLIGAAVIVAGVVLFVKADGEEKRHE